MAAAGVELSCCFGLKSDVGDNVWFLEESAVVYAAGSALVIHHASEGQKFIPQAEGATGATALAVSPNRRFVAVAEKAGVAAAAADADASAQISIYDLQSLKRRKVLSHSESQCSEFISLCFSPDSKSLVSLGGGPSYTLLYWAWETAQGPMASVRCAAAASAAAAAAEPDTALYRVTVNPQDNTNVCVSGRQALKMYRYAEGNLKQLAFAKVEDTVLCQSWLPEEAVVCGTESGKVLIFQAHELKAEIVLRDKPTALAPLAAGFVVGTAGGSVLLYARTDSKDYVLKREAMLPSEPGRSQGIHHLAASPSGQAVVCSTTLRQLYIMPLTDAPAVMLQGDELPGLKPFSYGFHHGAITALDVCQRRPVVVTGGMDCSIRVWNFLDNTLELSRYFAEEVYSLALHPSGHFLLAGFGDKLRFLNLMMEDIRPVREFSIRECKECRFSNGGHLFAAAQGNIIQIYSTWTFHNVCSLKGHNGRVRSLCWAADDGKLVSCGIDGAVYEWDMTTKQRSAESVLKSCNYTCAVAAPDGSAIYAVGSDHSLKEIRGNVLQLELPTKANNGPEVALTQVTISGSGRMLLAGTEQGAVRSFKYPLSAAGEWSALAAHVGAITRMRVAKDDSRLFTVGEDGCLFVYVLSEKAGRSAKQDDAAWADEVLVGRADLVEKNATSSELQQRVEELQMANEYQLRLKDMNYEEKLKELSDKGAQEREELQQQLQKVQQRKSQEQQQHEAEQVRLQELQQVELQALEQQNNQKLLAEYKKFQDLQQSSQEMQERNEQHILALETAKDNALKDLAEFWEMKLRDKAHQLDATNDMSLVRAREADETIRQIEMDADCEILGIKLSYEKLLKEERENCLRLKGDNGILGKKFKSLQREIEEERARREEMQAEQKKLHAHIKALEREIVSGKKEIDERDETIQDKEKRIYDLKKKNQELEKFKFVLDYKIKEVKKQIEPRENDIKEMHSKIAAMDAELEKYHKTNKVLELELADLRLKLRASDKTVEEQGNRVVHLANTVTRFRADLQATMRFIQEPKQLSSHVKQLFAKHCLDTNEQENAFEEDVQLEHNRQRVFLERNIASLKKKLAKAEELHHSEMTRIMRENVTLIKEINDLRKELLSSKHSVQMLEGTLRNTRALAEMHGSRPLPTTEETLRMSGQLQMTVGATKDADQADRIIDMQKDEIRRLRATVRDMERTHNSRPPSSGRLPPVAAL